MLAIIDYGAGNLFSVANALKFLAIPYRITDDTAVIEEADGVILPGVGAFPEAMQMLSNKGLIASLKKAAAEKPFLGICLGMQMLFDFGYEFTKTPGLGLISGEVRQIEADGQKIPHMGWNSITINKECPLTHGLHDGEFVYYVHSYGAYTAKENIAITSDYGGTITGLVFQNHLYGAQFHPEKSGAVGLKNFTKFREAGTMIILPAIDIKDGQCVRLYKGDFATVEKVADSPLETAKAFEAAGAKWLHLVDLDGAVQKQPVNSEIFAEIAAKTNLKLEVGGGIRNMATIAGYLDHGVSRIILGSAAVNEPTLVAEAVELYGECIAVGIDAENELVKAQGWLDNSQIHYLDLAKAMDDIGVRTIIFTDISKDGTLSGPNITQLAKLQQSVSANIIASGGISNIDDIKHLAAMNLYGAICGKSLYKGTLDLRQAIAEGGNQLC